MINRIFSAKKIRNAITAFFVLTGGFIPLQASINSVVLTPAAPTIVKGQAYYLAGVQYDFRVQVIDPDADGNLTHYTTVTCAIPLNGVTTVTLTWTASTDAFTATSAGSSVLTSSTRTGTQNLDLHFIITFAYDIDDAVAPPGIGSAPASRTITATANCSSGSPVTLSHSLLSSYGFCSQIRVYNLAQSGDAADGMINPYYSAGTFNVTGTLVYNITGVDASDAIQGTVGTVSLYDDVADDFPATVNNTSCTDVSNDTALSISVPYTYFNGQTLRAYYWRCSVAMTGLGGATWCQNSLPLANNRVLVTGMTVDLGGGRDTGNTHWKSLLVPGTRFTINAQMHNGGGNMSGDTTFYINYNGAPDDTTEFSVTIPHGSNSASVIIPGGSIPAVTSGTTVSYAYYVVRITGSSYGTQNETGSYPLTIATTPNRIVDSTLYPGAYYTAQGVFWENGDPPPTTTQSVQSVLLSADNVTLYWTPVNPAITSGDEGDFYEYRVYFREQGSGLSWSQWDGDQDAALRGLTANPSPVPGTDATNHFLAGIKYTNITNLKIFTNYEYYLVVVDLFGTESPVTDSAGLAAPPAAYSTFLTTPYALEASVTDGITSYANSEFSTVYTDRPLRETNIRVTLKIVTTADSQPDSVKVWFTNDPTTNIVNTSTTPATANTSAFADPYYLESAAAVKSSANTWVAYLPTTSPVIKQSGTTPVRFVVETTLKSVSSFSDYDISGESPADPNDMPWAFAITKKPAFTPWPTRVLNNVIDRDHPAAYPSFYLTDDAQVTIRIYDIKGRPVFTLLDGALRYGGQNIKEDGWTGINKARRNVGVGLYYMHIKAKRVSDGKVIIDTFEKVVVAR